MTGVQSKEKGCYVSYASLYVNIKKNNRLSNTDSFEMEHFYKK
jgi:hypothetical protein